ncbi:XkdX family protein [Faecalibacterium prausnitzii]|uniref:XkdX family protein n=1 Tax=Faecalibacterium prausnitzii TaxID=853 RepID=UPI0022E1E3A8|nr:XkdX family protein [Faecalibacterium prausnitzii]
MNIIWANRLIAGTKTWAEMPTRRRPGVKRELAKRVAEDEITAEQYKEITGEDYNE